MNYRAPTGFWFRQGRFDILRWAVLCVAMVPVAFSLGQKPDAQSVEDSLRRVQQWGLDPGGLANVDVQRLAHAGETRAIPALKVQFPVTKDAQLKLAIASALVRLGEKGRVYWDFLADSARVAVENDAPPLFQLDSQGNILRNNGQLPPEFIAWAKAHDLDPAAAAEAQVYELPIHFAYLAMTGDPRGRALLVGGLNSRNFLIQSYAAKGLAKLQDKNSIPLIIRAAKNAPRQVAALIAEALLFFDDQRAQSAAETFISDKQMLESLRKRVREKGRDPFWF